MRHTSKPHHTSNARRYLLPVSAGRVAIGTSIWRGASTHPVDRQWRIRTAGAPAQTVTVDCTFSGRKQGGWGNLAAVTAVAGHARAVAGDGAQSAIQAQTVQSTLAARSEQRLSRDANLSENHRIVVV
jgi:hypothetical protein